MKRLFLITTLTALAGLFVAGQAMSAGQQHMGQKGMSGSGSTAMMEGEMPQGMMSPALNQAQIREAQRLLNQHGLKAGAEDGLLGEQTRTAIREFQQSQQLTANGTLDEPTLRALAPTPEQQEFFGLSPAYSEPVNKNLEPQPMEQQQKPEGTTN